MSAFTLKLVAMIAMLFDHIVAAFGWEGWGFFPVGADVVRNIARLSYPIFAFCIVNGWSRTRDRQKYLTRLCLFALVSQIPYTLAFYPTNLFVSSGSTEAFRVRFSPGIAVVALLCTAAYWYFCLRRQCSLSILAVLLAGLLPACYLLDINGIRVVGDELNVGYTLALGAGILFVFDSRKEHLRWWEYGTLIAVTVLAVLAYGFSADYGIGLMGLVLIAALYFEQGHRPIQAVTIFAWGCLYYGLIFQNWYNALGTAIPAVLILLYQQKKGSYSQGAKRLFYVFYPAHLLVIGLINVYLNLS